MNLKEFLNELNKPKSQRKWIEKKIYKKLMIEYRNCPEVLENKRINESIISNQNKSRRYKRW